MSHRKTFWRIAVILLLLALALPLTSALAADTFAPASQVTLNAVTTNIANLRTGPGTGYGVILAVPYNNTVSATGRNADSSWTFVNHNGTPGWIYSTLLIFQGGSPTELPIVDTIVPGAP